MAARTYRAFSVSGWRVKGRSVFDSVDRRAIAERHLRQTIVIAKAHFVIVGEATDVIRPNGGVDVLETVRLRRR